ncbi:MAG TPA: hypothetical protein VGW74_06370 [Propionibacteriaceae bacterium]|nr:hypothetical protein [Propionibacteriaceae bacterium]
MENICGGCGHPIKDLEQPYPGIPPICHDQQGCTVVDCGCTRPYGRWRAADLPEGSVVAAWADAEYETGRPLYSPTGVSSVIFHRTDSRTVLGGGYPWVTADLPTRINPDAEVQRALDGSAQVLRVGTGKEG